MNDFGDKLFFALITLIVIFIISFTGWGIYTSTTRDRKFEDNCRVSGGKVVYGTCTIILIPEKDSIIAVKPY